MNISSLLAFAATVVVGVTIYVAFFDKDDPPQAEPAYIIVGDTAGPCGVRVHTSTFDRMKEMGVFEWVEECRRIMRERADDHEVEGAYE